MKRLIVAFFALALFSNLAAAESLSSQASQLVDLKKVFASAPIIYSVLLFLSVGSFTVWLYSLSTFRSKDFLPQEFVKSLKVLLRTSRFDEAGSLCERQGKLLGSIVSAGLATRQLGPQIMIDAMKSEGKRASTTFWQRLSLLNDVVIIAPMLGLLGTVIGMFYAFYDVNRSVESINALFDGLGIAVGTTVVGLVVAILAMIFYTTLKYQLIKTLSSVENEALALSPLIEQAARCNLGPSALSQTSYPANCDKELIASFRSGESSFLQEENFQSDGLRNGPPTS